MLSNELKIVGRAVPELATRYLDKVEKLGEILGQVHDLDCAAATAERHPRWFGSEAECDAVRGLVAEHRVVLEREAFALAAGLFAGRARDVRELVETGWETWRKRAAEGRRGRDRTGGLMTAREAARRRDDRGGPRAGAGAVGRGGAGRARGVNTASYRDGHTRPRALAFNPDDGLLYVGAVDRATRSPSSIRRRRRRACWRASGPAAFRTRSRRCRAVGRSSRAASIRACGGFAGGARRRLARDARWRRER